MALQVKRKNIAQKPTRSNPYLNERNLPYQKGIIMQEGGELQPGQLSQSDIEKRIKLENKLMYEKSLPENQGKRYNWYQRNIKNPLDKMGVNTDAIEFGLEGASMLESGLALGSLAKNNLKRLLKPQHSEEIVRGPINWYDNPTFIKNNPGMTGEQYINNNGKFGKYVAEITDDLIPFDKRTLTKEQYKKFMGSERTKMKRYNKAIGGMINPYREVIPNNYTEPIEDNYDEYDDIEMEYEDKISEKDIQLEEKTKEYQMLLEKNLENENLIKRLEKSKFEYQQQKVEEELINIGAQNLNESNLSENTKSNVGRYGRQIMSELSSSLGYTPSANSIFRTPEKQEELIKKGFGVKNSFHLTGDAVDLKPADWKKVPDMVKSQMKSKYDIISHNNHIHIEPKTRFQVGGVYEGIDYNDLEKLKKLGYKFEIL